MNLKVLLVGVAIGFSIAVAPSCGSAACSTANCAGCCSSAGVCITKDIVNDSACGSQGAACVTCTTMNQVCNKTTYTCAGGAGGGSGGGMGGGSGGGMGTVDAGQAQPVDAGMVSGPVRCDITRQASCPAGQACMVASAQGDEFCFAGDCDLVNQTQCTTANTRCGYGQTSDGGVGRICGPVGPNVENGACGATGADDCGRGLLCVNKVCLKYCYQDTDCAAGSLCRIFITIPTLSEHPLACQKFTTCDPLLQNCTASGEGCYPSSAGSVCETAGTVAVNGSCANANCVKGAVCLNGPSGAFCKQICNLDAGMPSCAGSACAALTATNQFGACP